MNYRLWLRVNDEAAVVLLRKVRAHRWAGGLRVHAIPQRSRRLALATETTTSSLFQNMLMPAS
jgi:hypothetical protein